MMRITRGDFEDLHRVINRRGTWSAKWETLPPEHISLSVAEMEFACAPAIRVAIEKAAARGIYSYTEVFPDFASACTSWFARRHGTEFGEESVVFVPRIVEATAMICAHMLPAGAKVITLSPAYDPIMEVVRRCGCQVTEPSMFYTEGTWHIPFDELATILPDADLFILTNPHNPTGRAFTQEELERLSELLAKSSCLVLSDDIHCDILRAGRRWLPLARYADAKLRTRLITALSPSKSFNMAGLEASALIVPDHRLRARIREGLRAAGFHNPNYFAIPAAIAAWTQCEEWLNTTLAYIDNNMEAFVPRFGALFAREKAVIPDATYLFWCDTRRLGAATAAEVCAGAGVHPSYGKGFGPEWHEYLRFNLAAPQSLLDTALQRCEATVQKLR
ncbi:MalY/PatB family protein [Actinotignum sanguinis]|uniref:cysteine-S-conjugate beta-lyase n=3 Tax=Actinomycetaceae TaxID=2049 RepID=A0ABZ0RD04_9ACTO|nr:aminotransferase class I/II-fold pyridoxal phosphate-dependent enzyme [Actinotignum sanguinis]WPJ89799.1 aminotransferase class I/II-fold pyridoxal phosphate-dependent enzyme [Schaalia turicensis]MDE1552032.1 aminotransferase class I/II-fold pyridoxal phosphate-dependent enzyme [Actinotignum sanguinis]MDE1642750.1 aminotransferase class I/II-fold pyridoxal phosphate-dependent enzyme [Actinotignum sanguinis]MDE1655530.1 aminotransferase class I/II-fold pyridoxal phosphate-dependent enzyme [Ac